MLNYGGATVFLDTGQPGPCWGAARTASGTTRGQQGASTATTTIGPWTTAAGGGEGSSSACWAPTGMLPWW